MKGICSPVFGNLPGPGQGRQDQDISVFVLFHLDQTVKDILTPILGLSKKDNATPWSQFYGSMPEIDSSAWTREISEMRKIDEEMWK
jgi:hypothetical protein